MSPDLEIQNELEQRQTESVELTIFPDGTVDYEERFGATLNAELDLRKFPFDRQTLELELQSFVWDRKDRMRVSQGEGLRLETIRFEPCPFCCFFIQNSMLDIRCSFFQKTFHSPPAT